MTNQEQEQQIGKLVLKKQELKRQIACQASKLRQWARELGHIEHALDHAAAAELQLGQAQEENTFQVATRRPPRFSQGDLLTYPQFDEIVETIQQLQQARLDLNNIEDQLKNCGIQ